MSFQQQSRNIQVFGTAGEAISALSALGSERSWEPMPLALQHIVAVFAVIHHLMSMQQIPKAQDFRNMDVFRARQALIAKRA